MSKRKSYEVGLVDYAKEHRNRSAEKEFGVLEILFNKYELYLH